ncbi:MULTISPECIES: hypothetical protein [Methylobacillus]|uniref:Uncharacterized protein n=1 Tax=Methylobacillus flagellatus (strain ATCC 51484 / DSM 6875 / VKM B-1610 / KT) TaxID=265072 RepID=Q1GY29_METFK|nr:MULTISPECIES: hypothetical protein [Methylobacillus]ABE50858.1 hypothetical protein Mfla_2593 [Methylobacillus flagellatus KT]MPS47548.1 hypothetical protein [Methylobacillus sp.]
MMKTLATLSLSLWAALPANATSLAEDEFQIMKACHVNATAMNLNGQVREHYLNNCVLSSVSEAAHQARKQCQISATAMNLDGDTRRNYLASCLASN